MEYQIELVDEPARSTAVRRFAVDPAHIADQMGPAFGAVAGFLARHHVPITGPAIAVYDMAPDGMTAAVGFEVTGEFEGDDDVEPYTVPAAEALCTTHVGAYPDLPKAYEALRGHAGQAGRTLDEHRMWEEYLTGPDVPPESTRTRVVWPLLPV
jgi:effector-binding domain-containing protein